MNSHALRAGAKSGCKGTNFFAHNVMIDSFLCDNYCYLTVFVYGVAKIVFAQKHLPTYHHPSGTPIYRGFAVW